MRYQLAYVGVQHLEAYILVFITLKLILVHLLVSKFFHEYICHRFAVGDKSFANNWLKKTTWMKSNGRIVTCRCKSHQLSYSVVWYLAHNTVIGQHPCKFDPSTYPQNPFFLRYILISPTYLHGLPNDHFTRDSYTKNTVHICFPTWTSCQNQCKLLEFTTK